MPDTAELLTYLTGTTEPGSEGLRPRVGDAVHLRSLPGGFVVEAWSEHGSRLGRLPPAERNALAGLTGAAPADLRGQITTLVPRPLLASLDRIHIRVTASLA